MAEVDKIELFNALHGHKYFREKKLDQGLVNYTGKLLELDLPFGHLKLYPKRGFKKDSKDFMTSLFRLHKIGYLEDEQIEDMLLYYDFNNIKEVAQYYNTLATYIDPYRLPIKYDNDVHEGMLQVQALLVDDDSLNLKLFKDLDLFFQRYVFDNIPSMDRGIILTHEVTHTQLESNKGITRDFYNGEVMSIFLELLHAYNKSYDLFIEDLAVRINQMALECIRLYGPNNNVFEKATSFKYVYSTMKAINLLDLYINGNSNIKREIIENIQANFDGEQLVEDTLNRFNINTGSRTSLKSVKRLIK